MSTQRQQLQVTKYQMGKGGDCIESAGDCCVNPAMGFLREGLAKTRSEGDAIPFCAPTDIRAANFYSSDRLTNASNFVSAMTSLCISPLPQIERKVRCKVLGELLTVVFFRPCICFLQSSLGHADAGKLPDCLVLCISQVHAVFYQREDVKLTVTGSG